MERFFIVFAAQSEQNDEICGAFLFIPKKKNQYFIVVCNSWLVVIFHMMHKRISAIDNAMPSQIGCHKLLFCRLYGALSMSYSNKLIIMIFFELHFEINARYECD